MRLLLEKPRNGSISINRLKLTCDRYVRRHGIRRLRAPCNRAVAYAILGQDKQGVDA